MNKLTANREEMSTIRVVAGVLGESWVPGEARSSNKSAPGASTTASPLPSPEKPSHINASSSAADSAATHDDGSTSSIDSSQSGDEFRAKRSRADLRLTEEEYIMVAKDIMGKPPFSGYLKYHLPLRYAARCEEVRWQWQDSQGKMYFKELIGGGRNSDLEYD